MKSIFHELSDIDLFQPRLFLLLFINFRMDYDSVCPGRSLYRSKFYIRNLHLRFVQFRLNVKIPVFKYLIFGCRIISLCIYRTGWF